MEGNPLRLELLDMNVSVRKVRGRLTDTGDLPGVDLVRAEQTRRQMDKVKEVLAVGRLRLAQYVKLAWHVVEPSRSYVHGWHIDAICEHLEAITYGELIRLLITIPPGMMKSLLTGVFWPSWEWGPENRPATRWIGFSYENALSTRDSLRCRRLMQSDWFQQLWGHQFKFTGDQNVKTRYENDKTGFRISDYVGGGTGDRGDRDLVDDPHNVKDGESETKRQSALLWLAETLPTRLNDPEHSAIVVIHHRIHEQDMAGEIISKNLGYEHLMLPMEFEVRRKCTTKIGFKDPRKHEGELLFPQRFPKEVVARDKIAMGSYAVAGQFQQRPSPRGGGVIKRQWFEVVEAFPADCYWCRHWDLAATRSNKSAFTCGLLMGRSRSSEMFYIADVIRVQEEGDEVRKLITQTTRLDENRFGKANYSVSLPQDPGQAGKVQAKDYTRRLAGHDIYVEIETGEKEVRARPFAAQAEAGNVKLVEGAWIEAYLAEAVLFPTGRYKDQIDASSGAFGNLIMNPKRQLLSGRVRGLY